MAQAFGRKVYYVEYCPCDRRCNSKGWGTSKWAYDKDVLVQKLVQHLQNTHGEDGEDMQRMMDGVQYRHYFEPTKIPDGKAGPPPPKVKAKAQDAAVATASKTCTKVAAPATPTAKAPSTPTDAAAASAGQRRMLAPSAKAPAGPPGKKVKTEPTDGVSMSAEDAIKHAQQALNVASDQVRKYMALSQGLVKACTKAHADLEFASDALKRLA